MILQNIKKYEKYKSLIKFILISSGVWPDCYKHPRFLKTFLLAIGIFSGGCTTYGIIGFCVKNYSNINIITTALGLLITTVIVFLKLCVLALHASDLLILNQGISVRFENDLRIPEFRPHLLAHFSTFSIIFYAFAYGIASNVILRRLIPIVALVKYGKYVTSIPQVMPFDYEPGGIIHWLIYLIEIINGYYIWSMTVGFDSIFGLYVLHLVGELRLLSARFKSLTSSKNYKKDIKECIDLHNMLMKTKEIIQRIFGTLITCFVITSAVVVCVNIYQASKIENMTPSKFILLIVYLSFTLLQAYIYTWFGNIMIVESEMCINAIYNARWTEFGDLRFMNDMLIIQSQHPLYFRASGVLLVQFDMFLKIINTSVSYFFLLRTLDKND